MCIMQFFTTFMTHVEKIVTRRKVAKEPLNFVPSMNTLGKHKLKVLIIGKSKNPFILRKHKNEPCQQHGKINHVLNGFYEWYFDNSVLS